MQAPSFSGHFPTSIDSTMSNKGLEALANIASSSQVSERGDANIDNGGNGSKPAAQQAELSNSTAPSPPASSLASLNSLTNSLATSQQLQQLLNAAGIGQSLQSTAANMNLLGLHQPQPQPQGGATDPALLLSQLSQIAHLQQMFGRTQQPQGMINSLVSNFSGVQGGHNHQEIAKGDTTSRSQVFIVPNTCATSASMASTQQHATGAMPPPVPSKPTSTGDVKMPPGSPQQRGSSLGSTSDDMEVYTGDKKFQKRAANRLSAQLSRKRKKQFMEELKDENDDLKRKEQILKSIPDLIVVFDSTGKLWFVSESVSRFLQFSAMELEGSSIWERLCEDSVRLLKAAFMDSLAAREADSDTAPLGSGFWELRLVDRDGSYKVVTLNGVVHFAGERPECVCSIRPSDGSQYDSLHGTSSKAGDVYHDGHQKSLIRIKPQQSVVSSGSGSGSSDSSSSRRKSKRANLHAKDRESMRISNSENSSESNSETASGNGSCDE